MSDGCDALNVSGAAAGVWLEERYGARFCFVFCGVAFPEMIKLAFAFFFICLLQQSALLNQGSVHVDSVRIIPLYTSVLLHSQ